jgi:hypothetical protein
MGAYTLSVGWALYLVVFGEDFVCPTCGAPKDKFTDLNADAEA